MLWSGTEYRKVPTDPAANVRLRAEVMAACRADAGLRTWLKAECRRDLGLFINLFGWQFNPLRDGNRVGPFILWDFQEEALRRTLWCRERKKSAVVEKSREMGGTYLYLFLECWLAGFWDMEKCLNVSRSAEAVDSGEPDCLFWKLRHILEHVPTFLLGERPVSKKFRVHFPATGSYITGTASTSAAGVGGRASFILHDEFALVEDGREMRRATANTADWRVFCSTHLGMDTEFHNLVFNSPEIEHLRLHWTQHPEKRKGLYEYDPLRPSVPVVRDTAYQFPPDYPFVLDGSPAGGPRPGVRSPWYDAKCREIGDSRGVAMDLDINPSGSSSQFFDAVVIRRLVEKARPPVWEGDLRFDRDSGEPQGLVEGGERLVRLWVRPDALGRLPPAPYGVGTDVGEGVGATPSCASAIDARTGIKAAEVETTRLNVEKWATLAVALCRWLVDAEGRTALLCWEKAGSLAQHFKRRVADLGYWSIYFHTETSKAAPVVSDIPGFYPSPTAKGELLREYKLALADDRCKNYSARALKSTLGFTVGAKGEPEHPMDNNYRLAAGPAGESAQEHGDLVIADALAWMMARKLDRRRDNRPAGEPAAPETPWQSFGWRRQERELSRAESDEPYYAG